jgi:hypothetical protein
MIYDIKPKPTIYAGKVFRSQLESQWARYFEGIGLAWEYEPRIFHLPTGPYIPDFCIGTKESGPHEWVEVKPDGFGSLLHNQKAKEKIAGLCEATRERVHLLIGAPRGQPNQHALYMEDPEGVWGQHALRSYPSVVWGDWSEINYRTASRKNVTSWVAFFTGDLIGESDFGRNTFPEDTEIFRELGTIPKGRRHISYREWCELNGSPESL